MYWDKISKYLNIKWLMPKSTETLCCLGVMMFNGTFNNISVIWCMANSFIGGWNRSTLRNHLILPAASHWPTLPHIVSSTSYNDRDSNHNFRDRPFNLKGGYGFLFRSEFFFPTTRELEYLFFLSRIARNFFPEFNIWAECRHHHPAVIEAETKDAIEEEILESVPKTMKTKAELLVRKMKGRP